MITNIVLDFGHGGIDSNGKYTTAPKKMYKHPNGEVAYEGVLNRAIGGKVYRNLISLCKYNVICTVKEDDPRDISLSKRVEIANKYPKDSSIFVSIHCNAGKGDGFEIFTSRGQTKSDLLAEEIADSVEGLYKIFRMKLRYDFSDGDKDKEADFYVLRKTKGVAVLLECGFFDNMKNYKLLKDPSFQEKLAKKISDGIVNFIEKQNKKQ